MEESITQTPSARRVSVRKAFKALWFVVIALTVVVFWITFYDSWSGEGETGNYYAGQDCNVAGINAHGEVVTYAFDYEQDSQLPTEASSEYIIMYINEAEEAENIKAIVIDIDSYGGSPVAAQEIANTLKQATKPTVALIREAGASAAYWAATGADVIIASDLSDVGGIGVTLSYLDASKYNVKEGYVYNELRTAPYKDYGDPDKPLTADERALMMRDLTLIHEAFVKAVAENRKLDIKEVEKLADGSTMPGKMAIEYKLIDRIGSYPEVDAYLTEQIGEKPEICW